MVAFAAAVATTGCDSKTRGQEQSAGSADQTRRTQASRGDRTADASAPTPPPSSRDADLEPPAASALQRYTDDLSGEGALVAKLVTSEGTIRCRLYEDRAPVTVANFVGLARGLRPWLNPESGAVVRDTRFYDGVAFHRVIPGFIVQAGDRTGTGHHGAGYTIPEERHPSLSHDHPGTLSMANRGPDTGSSQFFITLRPLPRLDGRHTVFGRCNDLDVVRSIARTPAGPNNHPESPVTLETITFERTDLRPEDPTTSPAPDTGATAP